MASAQVMNSNSNGDTVILLPGTIILSVSVRDEETDNAALTTARIVAMVVLGVVSFLLGLLPLCLVKIFKYDITKTQKGPMKLVLSMMLCFGAGVLLCISLAHILPELRESIESLQATGDLPLTSHSLPLAEIFVISGFFAVYLVEESVHLLYGSHGHHGHSHAGHSHHQTSRSVSDSMSSNINNSSDVLIDIKQKLSYKQSFLESINGMLFVLALSFHEIFEGLAVGLEHDASGVYYLMGAVAAHKFIIAFCLGIELLVARVRSLILILYVVVFSVVTPVGIGIGMALTSEVNTDTTVTTVLEGMAAGTLVYVVFMEVLQRERTSEVHYKTQGFCQFLAFFLGFAAMLGLFNIAGHEHEHEEHNHDKLTIRNVTGNMLENLASNLADAITGLRNHSTSSNHNHHH